MENNLVWELLLSSTDSSSDDENIHVHRRIGKAKNSSDVGEEGKTIHSRNYNIFILYQISIQDQKYKIMWKILSVDTLMKNSITISE